MTQPVEKQLGPVFQVQIGAISAGCYKTVHSFASPQSQFGSSVYPQRVDEDLVFPTLHRALLRERHCFLFSAVSFVKVSLAGGVAGKRSAGVVAAHLSTLAIDVAMCK